MLSDIQYHFWNRRKALFTVAKEQGCNKIALGHHMDDILETLLSVSVAGSKDVSYCTKGTPKESQYAFRYSVSLW